MLSFHTQSFFMQGFGKADHKVTKDVLCKALNYPNNNVTWRNTGY